MRVSRLIHQDLLRLALIMSLWSLSLLIEATTPSPLALALDMLIWLSLFVGGVAGVSRLQALQQLYLLHQEQRAPHRRLERLFALGPSATPLAPPEEHTANAKLNQAFARRHLIITRKIRRGYDALQRKRGVQNVCTLIAVSLLIATRYRAF